MLAGLSGAIEVSGVTYSGLVMPPQGQLDDEQLAAIGNYILGSLNDSQEHLPESLVADVRAAPKTHTQLREIRRSGN
jgi:mono/diheme cytochrome c family protein